MCIVYKYCVLICPTACRNPVAARPQLSCDAPAVFQVCQRPFHSKGDLGKHMVFRHTTEKNFPCPDCDASFKTSWMMKRHLSRVHARF